MSATNELRTSAGILRITAMLVLGWLALAGSAAAQIPAIDLSIGPRAGYFLPLGIIAKDAADRETTLSTGLGIGATIEVDLPASPIDLRATVDATFGRALELNEIEINGTNVDLLVLAADLVFRPLPRLVVAQPYLLAGAGIKRYSSDNTFDDTTDFTGHLGAGADMNLGRVTVLVEVSDYISGFQATQGDDTRLQNDVFVMVGFQLKLL